jgi:competence protein ComEC
LLENVIDTSLIAGVCLLAGAIIPLSPYPLFVALCAAILVAWRRISARQATLAVVMLTVGAWRSSSSFVGFDEARDRARERLGAPARCSGTVVVRTSPTRIGEAYSLFAEAQTMECDGAGHIDPGTRLRLYSPIDDLARGDTCFVIASVGVVEIPRNTEIDTSRAASARAGAQLSGGALDVRIEQRPAWSVSGWIDRARAFCRRRIEATYPAQAAPMARALVLGENDLAAEDAEAFRLSGLSHILAVSGTHIVIAVFGIVGMVRGALVRVETLSARFEVGRVAAAVGVPLAWLYSEFAGSGGSVRRAAIMATTALVAHSLARNPSGPRAFGLSLVVGGLVDPLAVFDFSFGLSAAATAGLLSLSRPLEATLARFPPPVRWAATPMATTLSATAFCAPWLVLLSPTLSPVGVIANILAVPIGETISLPACLGHLVLSPWPDAQRGVALLASASLLAVRTVAHASASLDWAAIPLPRPTGWHLAILAIVALWLTVRRPRDRILVVALGAVAYVVLEALSMRAGQPLGRLRITFLDVGQGDSALIDFPDGSAMLIDGGGAVGSPVDPGKTVVGPMLRARRRSRVDIGVLSHPHPDHFIGLASALPAVGVGQFWDTGQGESAESGPVYNALLANLRRRGIPVLRPTSLCSKNLALGNANVRVLAPCPDLTPGVHANDNSFVLRVSMGTRSALLVGDAESEQEGRLLALDRALLRAEVLKVGHHGSRTSSTPEFLDAVGPSKAVISCGVRNRFGHPHPHTLDHLAARGIQVLRTDRLGAVVWETDGNRSTISSTVQLGP